MQNSRGIKQRELQAQINLINLICSPAHADKELGTAFCELMVLQII